MSLENIGSLPEANLPPGEAPAPKLRHDPSNDAPLSAAEELSLELEGEQDRSRLIQRLQASDNLYEQAECLQRLVLLLGRDAEIPWSDAIGSAPPDSSGSIRLEAFLERLWKEAS
jgi:hypothetical protein